MYFESLDRCTIATLVAVPLQVFEFPGDRGAKRARRSDYREQPGPESAKSGNRTRVAQSRPSFSPSRSRSTKRQLISPGHTPGPVVISNSRARIGSPPRLHRASLARNEPPNGKLVVPLHRLKLRFQPIQLPIIRRHYQLYRPSYGKLH